MNTPEQRTDDWRLARAGKLTASCFGDVIALTRAGKPTAERGKLMRLKAFERLSGIPKHEVGARALAWGQDLEVHAIEAYQVMQGEIVEPASFITHPEHSFIGCSPDGLVGAAGGIEMKCPHDEQVHILTWLEGMPADHVAQVQGCMLVTGRQWWDFISYDPRMAEPWRLYVQRVPRDDAYCANLLAGLLQFEAELCEMVDTLRQKAA